MTGIAMPMARRLVSRMTTIAIAPMIRSKRLGSLTRNIAYSTYWFIQ